MPKMVPLTSPSNPNLILHAMDFRQLIFPRPIKPLNAMDIDGLHDNYGDPQEITQFTPDGNSMVPDFMFIEYSKVTFSDLFFVIIQMLSLS